MSTPAASARCEGGGAPTPDWTAPAQVRERWDGPARWLADAGFALFLAPAGIAFIVMAFAAVGMPSPAPRSLGLLALWSLGAAPVLCVTSLLLARHRGSASPSELRANAEGLRIADRRGGERFIPRRRIAGALAVPGRERVELRLTYGSTLDIELEDDESADALVHALALGSQQRWLASETGGPYGRALAGLAGMLAAVAFVVVVAASTTRLLDPSPFPAKLKLALLLVLAPLIAWLSRRMLKPRRLAIGSDGLVVERIFGSDFVAYENVATMALEHETLRIQLKNGALHSIPLGAQGPGVSHALFERIRATMEATDGPLATPDARTRPSLERQGRSTAEWIKAMTALTRPSPGYRRTSAEVSELLRVVRDGRETVERRLGAAIAVAASRDADGRVALRVASESCANDRVRIALAELADDEEVDDAALESALAQVSDG